MVLLQAITFAVTVGAALAECAGIQCLKHGDEVTSLLQTRTEVKKHSASPPGGQDCLSGLKHFEAVGNQKMVESDVGNDPLFPPVGTTIAAEGEECGDSAHDIHEDCSKFNHWKTMRDVGTQMKLPTFKTVPEVNEMDYSDIGQGKLGNCYFLAALAAVANHHQAVLRETFGFANAERSMFHVNFFLNGRWSKVWVDNMIPAGDHGPFFTQPSKDGEWWPVILAKAWAKVFGTYKAVEGGTAQTVVTALTGAPVTAYEHDSNDEAHNWKFVSGSAADKDVMIAGSRENAKKYGLASGHAYAVLETKKDFKSGGKSYGNVIQLMNPWRKDNYKGKVPNTEEINGPNHQYGVFTMLFSEYIDAFKTTGVAKVRDGLKAVSVQYDVDKPFVLEVKNPKKVTGEFQISMYWPNHRMVRPCEPPTIKSPPSMIFVADVQKLAEGRAAGQHLQTTNNKNALLSAVNSLTQEVTNQGGDDYATLIYAKFPGAEEYIKQVSLVLYGPAGFELWNSQLSPEEIVVDSMTPGKACSKVMLPGKGLFVRDESKVTAVGAPTFWNIEKSQFLYLADVADTKWGLASADWWQEVLDGGSRRLAMENIPGKDLPCGCDDLPEGVVGLTTPMTCADAKTQCSNEAVGAIIRQSCPKTCDICCVDNPEGVVGLTTPKTCAAAKSSCSQEGAIGALKRKSCPKTCESCPTYLPQ